MTAVPEAPKEPFTPLKGFLHTSGNLTRPEDDWCKTCNKPSLLEAPVVLVDIRGVTQWGFVVACKECRECVWTSLKGNVIPVNIIK